MLKSIIVSLFFTPLSIFSVSSKGEDIVGIEKEFADYLRNKVLEKTNYYRTKHGMNVLRLNAEMTNEAQEVANTLATSFVFEHGPKLDNFYGENIAKIPRIPNIGETVVELWYYGIAGVKVNDGDGQFRTNADLGTMTQLLWKSSYEMGVGVSQSEEEHFYVVAKFNPEGNIENEYTANLPQFKQEDVDEGIHELKYYNFTKKSMSISNLKTGSVAFSDLQKIEATADQEFPQEYKSEPYMESVGFRDSEAIKMRKKILEATNFYREFHKLKSLAINKTLSSLAQDMSNNLASRSTLDTSDNWNIAVLGMNKFRSTPVIFDDFGELAVTLWYNEFGWAKEDMQVYEAGNKYAISNLAQLLWNSTVDMGVGVSRGVDDWYYVVVLYQPPGNVPNCYIANLPKFGKDDIERGRTEQADLVTVIRQTKTVVDIL